MSLAQPLKIVLLVAGLVLLFAVPSMGLGGYVLALGVSFASMAILAGGLNLVYGYAGLMSYGQVGFFGIGAYTAGILVSGHGWGLVPATLLGALLAVLVALVLGYSSLRLSRHAFSIVSLSFSLLCVIIARDWVDVTRGPMGIPGLAAPPIQLGSLSFSLNSNEKFYYVMMALAVLSNGFIYVLVTSRIGRAMRTVKLNEPLAQSQGISPLGLKLLALGVSALLAALAGGVFVFYLSIVDPSIFDFYYTEAMLIMVIIGGAGSFWCVLLSVAVFSVLPDLLRFSPDLRLILYGIILIAAMLVMPGGLGGWLRQRKVDSWRQASRQRAFEARDAGAAVSGAESKTGAAT
jgi:branched-chain amino acid transport system permease protein